MGFLFETRETPLDFPAGFLSFALALHAGRFEIFPALDFLNDSVSVAFTLKPSERFLDRFVFAKFDADQLNNHLPFFVP